MLVPSAHQEALAVLSVGGHDVRNDHFRGRHPIVLSIDSVTHFFHHAPMFQRDSAVGTNDYTNPPGSVDIASPLVLPIAEVEEGVLHVFSRLPR